MERIFWRWLLVGAVLGGVLIVDGWLSGFFARLALVAVAAAALAWWFGKTGPRRDEASPETASPAGPVVSSAAAENLLGEVALALDHIRSIRILLEISQTHQQPVPPAVQHNLGLVAKHLESAQKQCTSEPIPLRPVEKPAPPGRGTVIPLPRRISAQR